MQLSCTFTCRGRHRDMKRRDTVHFSGLEWGWGGCKEGGGQIGHGLLLRSRQTVIVDPPTPGCEVRLTVAARRGRLVAEEVNVKSVRDGDGVTGGDLRTVPVAALLRQTLRL